MTQICKEYLKYSSYTLSAVVSLWTLVSQTFATQVPVPTFSLRMGTALVGTAMLLSIDVPLQLHVFWGLIHFLPLTVKSQNSDVKLDKFIVVTYVLLLAIHKRNPYTKLLHTT